MAETSKKYFWYSFSYQGNNQGVCLIEANSKLEADTKLAELKISPSHFNDVLCVPIEDQEIELNVLISPKDMQQKGYDQITSFG